ncbi:MAG: hypothetical protein ACN6OP_06480 [Pseudomonadales bacterium]
MGRIPEIVSYETQVHLLVRHVRTGCMAQPEAVASTSARLAHSGPRAQAFGRHREDLLGHQVQRPARQGLFLANDR